MAATDPAITRMTTEQREETLALLETLTPEEWESPSLCPGWSVHDVVAHLTLPYTSGLVRILVQTFKHRGDFDRAADTMARADAAEYAPEQLLEIVRTNLAHPWRPPGGGPAGALSHDVIHSWDITAALDKPTTVTPVRARTVLAAFEPSHLKGFGVDLRITRFEATDEAFAIGPATDAAHRTVSAPLLELVPLATGRRTTFDSGAQ